MKKKKAIKYVIAILAGAVLCLAVIFGKGIITAETVQQKIRILSDAFTAAGLILLLSGLLVWIVRQGTFTSMGYAFHSLFVSLHDSEYRESHQTTYGEYRDRKLSKNTPFLFLIITGAAFMIPAIVFTVLFFYV